MKKTCLLCVALCLSALLTNAQTTYDLFTYTEPNGYKKETKKDVVTYTKIDNKTATYCMISLYAQTPSSGDIKKDFENDWLDLVAKPLEIKDAPKADNNDDISGWKTYSGGANFEFSGSTSMAILTTAKKENVNISILVVTNAQSYLTTDVDLFFAKLTLGTPKNLITKAPIKVEKSAANVEPTLKNGRIKSDAIKNELLGEWYLSDGNAKITLLFAANGRYDKGAMVDRRIVRNLYETTTNLGSGSYLVSGTTITLIPKTNAKETYAFRIAFEKNSEGKIDKKLYLVRPIEGGTMYESEYWFVK
jgi:hypothetical protein